MGIHGPMLFVWALRPLYCLLLSLTIMTCDFLILYCGQTACNSNCMVCTKLVLFRYVA